ncbi:quinon protein alcohol dehydrogenase-like superfamily [Umbelopsis sp. PMI_123]|nr:quinon protein alcohol dehydrogenase-like superfamily [Umbelopsis sp. PMI_123]
MSSDYTSKLRSASRKTTIHTRSIPKSTEHTTNASKRHSDGDVPTIPSTPSRHSSDDSTRIISIDSVFPSTPPSRVRREIYGDRFIPVRDRNLATEFSLIGEPRTPSKGKRSNNGADTSPQSEVANRKYEAMLRTELLGEDFALDDLQTFSEDSPRTPRKLFTYGQSRSRNSEEIPVQVDSPYKAKYSTSPIGAVGQRILQSPQKLPRQISRTPVKVLDAPELQDDFYLNLVDWGSTDVLAVGLGMCVYLWNATTSKVTKLCDLGPGDSVTSVNWTQRGTHVAVGTNNGSVLIWDAEKCRKLRTMNGHTSRVGSLAWNNQVLTSGGRDRVIFHRDVRVPAQYFRKLDAHTQEVCGLKWNPDENMLASGGNDNMLMVWDHYENRILHKFTEHTAAVKAIAWNPSARGILVSGGGTADKTIKFWNTMTGSLLHSYDTGSQVCNILWSKTSNELVSTHGYAPNGGTGSNQVIVWKYDNMQRIATLTGHSYRVLYLSMSPDGKTIVTGAGDETLRFWDVFQSNQSSRRSSRPGIARNSVR